MSSAALPVWQSLVSSHGSALYAANVEPLSRFVPAYEALANEVVQLRHHNTELENQLAAAREALSTASLSGASGGRLL